MIDPSRIQAKTQWVLLKKLRPPGEDGLEKRGSLYIPSGTTEEKLGYAKAEVVSVGEGKWDKKRKRRVPPDFKAGDLILHRGYLAEINTISPLDDDYAFIHVDDVLVVFDQAEGQNSAE